MRYWRWTMLVCLIITLASCARLYWDACSWNATESRKLGLKPGCEGWKR